MIKRFVIALLLLVLVCGGIVGFNLYRNQAIQEFFANMPVQPVAVSTVTVEPAQWTPEIEAIGTVSATNGVDLTVEAAGTVSEIAFEANEEVEKDALLVQLDDAMQRADLASAQAQARLDEANLQRALELQRRQVGAEVNVESARAAAEASQAAVAKAQAAIDQKQINAPFAGIMGIPRVQLGQYITPGTVVATLQSLEVMRVDFTVPEQELPNLKIGQAVRLGLTGDELPFEGTIRGIDPKIDPVSRLVNVRAEVTKPEGRLTPGQFVEVRVILPDEDGVLAVPQTAVVASLYGDHVYVVVPADEQDADASAASDAQAAGEGGEDAGGQGSQQDAPSLVVKQVFVETGRRSGEQVEIRKGISAGDRIVTAGQNRLNNGTPVNVSEDDADTSGESAQASGQ
ncbi:efflux RND transporter periplasmic adaptor subunit [Chelativorans sp. M5D2P16]|uniref:efflux RND transporter periplasmic adaptor subunit n=1 Tax=Chelativorans sp. M5D2P16 TaxID=3095678 RepID=UPI002ACA271A|nr:efflux RND transporter periplasmic adaptor subunit [Chelativorans sp. M5D2P16]MDZ5696034.1 efflux RND transporter periplasmic adaptor subunit [Chelativorans sp. M5D2P16]